MGMKQFEIWSKTSAGDLILMRDGAPFVLGHYGSGKYYLENEMKVLPYVSFRLKENGQEDLFIFNEDGSKIIFHLVRSFETPGYIISEYSDCIESKYCPVGTFIDRVRDLFVATEMGV